MGVEIGPFDRQLARLGGLEPSLECHRAEADREGAQGKREVSGIRSFQAPIVLATVRAVGTIDVCGIRAVGRHGVLPEEQVRPQPFEIDLRIEADFTKAAATDRIEDTVDYALVTEAVARTVELESYRLLERLADRIAGVCLTLPDVKWVEVSVRKLRPPIPVHVASVGVTLRREAADPPAPTAAAAASESVSSWA